jgi:hypothetical protein
MIQDTTSPPEPPKGLLGWINRIRIRRVLGGILFLQIGLAGVLVAPDVDLDRLMGREPTLRTAVTDPVTPGSQTRPYSPRSLPRRADGAGNPGTVSQPGNPEMLEFRRVEHDLLGPVLLLAGGIGEGDSDRFERALDDLPDAVRTVVLHSPGGLVREAIRIGRLLREREMQTAVAADGACISACPLILFAGVERRISPQAWIGMHQAYLPQSSILPIPVALTSIQSLQGDVLQYTDDMGVDPMVHVHALATPPEEAYFLVEAELLGYRVATEMLTAAE